MPFQIDPYAQENTQHRRNGHGPSHNTEHAQSKPDLVGFVFTGPEFSFFPNIHLTGKTVCHISDHYQTFLSNSTNRRTKSASRRATGLACLALPFIQLGDEPIDRLMKKPQLSFNGHARGHAHHIPLFYQNAAIDRQKTLAATFGPICENTRYKGGRHIQMTGPDAEKRPPALPPRTFYTS